MMKNHIPYVAEAEGTGDAIAAKFLPRVKTLVNGMVVYVRAPGANTLTTPTFTPRADLFPPLDIVKGLNIALEAGDIISAAHWLQLQYDSTINKWTLLNPASSSGILLDSSKESVANKNATGGYVGLTLFKINFKNAANTFTSFFTNTNTASRTYTFKDADGTVAFTSDITGTNTGTNTGDETTITVGELISGATAKSTPVDADYIGLMDSAAANVLKKLSWANVKAKLKIYLDDFYESVITSGTTAQFYRGDKSWQTLDKSAVGLSNVANIDTTNASNISSGTLAIERLPPSAIERLYLYTGAQTAPENFGLTTTNVQNGDTVKVSNGGNASNGLMWIVKDDSVLSTSAAFEAYSVGSAASVPWSGVTSVPSNLSEIGSATFSNDDIIQKKSGTLTHRTMAQLASDLASGIISTALTGFTAGAGTVAATDSILQAIQKIVGNLAEYELLSNKSTSMATDFASNTKYLSAKAVYDWANATFAPIPVVLKKAIFGYGYNNAGSYFSMTNLVSNTGVVATDTTGVGTARMGLAAAGYGTDKAIFGYGSGASDYSTTNLVSNTGAVAANTTGVGTARGALAAAGYGTDKAIFGYGYVGGGSSITNLVSNTGVVASNTTGVGTGRWYLAAAGYGADKAIFGYGYTGSLTSLTNLVSNTGVVATDTTGVGTARTASAAAGYGTDKAIFGYGNSGSIVSLTNLVSNIGVVASDTTGVGTARAYLAAAGYGADKAIFGYGDTGSLTSLTNLVSNTGVVATDTTGVGTARNILAATGYGP